MSSVVKRIARAWLPPAALNWARRLTQPAAFTGNYLTWQEAEAVSRGYDDPAIFDQVLASARAVRDGHAAFERDSVTFAEAAIHGPLLAGLLRATLQNEGRLHVVDFGGGFGSAWWQHRAWLDRGADVTWEVIEQPHFVVAGRKEFEVAPLRFRHSLDECTANPRGALILLSSVLPYLEHPHDLVAEVARRGFRHVLIDRTGFTRTATDRLTVQRVPKTIYDATYPCWFFSKERLLQTLTAHYQVVAEWPSFDVVEIEADFKGMLLERVDA
jgi:putative methyltransferase (TIGR04325 family)